MKPLPEVFLMLWVISVKQHVTTCGLNLGAQLWHKHDLSWQKDLMHGSTVKKQVPQSSPLRGHGGPSATLVAGEGSGWRKFAETWVKFAGGAEASGTVNDEVETLARTSWRYCCNRVTQKDKHFNYGRFLHQEQKNVVSFQGWRSKDKQKLWKGL